MINRLRLPALILLTTISVLGCGDSPETAAAEAEAATAMVLAPQDVATAFADSIETGPVLTGSLEPADRVTLRAQVAGTIDAVRVDRGTRVSRGQTLAIIEAQGIRSAAAGAEAGVAAAQANVALARQQLEASRTLYQAGAISRIDLQSAEAAFEAAEAQLAAARAQAAGAIEAAGNTVIRSPITGVVSERMIEPGEAVNPGAELFTIVNAERLELAGQVPVDEAARVRVGQPVRFTLGADPDRELRGQVARIDPVADPQTRRVGLYVRLPNPGNRIIAGQFARGRVVGDRAPAVLLPETAVRQEGRSYYVLAVENGRVVRKEVRIVARDDAGGVVGVEGVSAGTQVIAAPGAQIAPGTPVQVGGQPAAPVRDTPVAGGGR